MSAAPKWANRGRSFVPRGDLAWARERAVFPTVEVISSGALRAYFTSMDDRNVGRVGFVDLDAADPARILAGPIGPVLEVGPAGAFDESGANAFSIVRDGTRAILYYQGWQLTSRAPYAIFSGAAEGDSQGSSFHRISRVPILDRIESDPFMRACPWVLREERDGRALYRMWYASCSEWAERAGKFDYRVSIAYLESDDPLKWSGEPRVVLSPDRAEDYATGRPCVIQINGIYHMWFSVRSFDRPYRLAHAFSRDGIAWTREDRGFLPSPSGDAWDSESRCYPCALECGGLIYLFYCGNGQGKTGFGCATAPVGDFPAL